MSEDGAPVSPVGKPLRRNPWILAAAVAVLVAGGGAVAVTQVSGSGPSDTAPAAAAAVASPSPSCTSGTLGDQDFKLCLSAVVSPAPSESPSSSSPSPTTASSTPSTSPTTPSPSASVTQSSTPSPSVSATTPPPGAPDRATWPGGTLNAVGARVATTRTVAGYSFDTVAKVKSFGANLTGSGTATDPYVVDRVTFTSTVFTGSDDSGSDIKGKYLVFTNSIFRGAPGNPTPGGSSYVNNLRSAQFARVTIADSTLGAAAGIASTGGSVGGGTDKGVQSYGPMTLLRDDIYGAAIPVYFETEQSEADTVVQGNWLHDVWSSSGDHTDVINGNFHASHVRILGNYIDGIRTGNSQAANCLGIYDDPATAAGIITDWTIDGNWITRCATGMLSNTSKTRFKDPFVVTNNVFGTFGLQRAATRAPSTQSGNRTTTGAAVTL